MLVPGQRKNKQSEQNPAGQETFKTPLAGIACWMAEDTPQGKEEGQAERQVANQQDGRLSA